MPRTNSARHLIDQLFGEHEISRETNLETSYLSAVCKLVGSELGLGFADPFSIDDQKDRVTPH